MEKLWLALVLWILKSRATKVRHVDNGSTHFKRTFILDWYAETFVGQDIKMYTFISVQLWWDLGRRFGWTEIWHKQFDGVLIEA